jgi:adenylate cyclase
VAEERVERRLAAILAADVVGYSRLMGEDEEGTLAALNAHLKGLIEPLISGHNGRIVKTTGDGLVVEFPSVIDAVQCAVAFQKGMDERNVDVSRDRRITFRVGINIGDVIIQGDDIFGDGVNVASRLEGLAAPSGICISRAARDQIRDKLEYGLEDLGEVEVKNIARPVRVFRVLPDNKSGASPVSRSTGTSGRNRILAAAALSLIVVGAGLV